MLIETYLEKSGLKAVLAQGRLADGFHAAVAAHELAIKVVLAPGAVDMESVQWQFRVPELGEGGSCSLFDRLAEQPYDLAATLGGCTARNQRMLAELAALVAYYRQHSRSQWFGVYQARELAGGVHALVKLAYFGAESRAEFPLTEEFAQGSNNSAVGLSGQARVINDVAAFVATGGGYYTCDPKVQSEACLPILGEGGEVLGIIDSEAFEQGLFVDEELALLVVMAVTIASAVFVID